MVILMAAAIVSLTSALGISLWEGVFWKYIAITLEPETCSFCHDCRALLAETVSEGYVLLELYNLEDIRAFAIENGAEYTICDYTVSIYKGKCNNQKKGRIGIANTICGSDLKINHQKVMENCRVGNSP